jgi:DUF1680 family protein
VHRLKPVLADPATLVLTDATGNVSAQQRRRRLPLEPLPPGDVELTAGESPLAEAAATNTAYLASMDPDRLVFSFRATAEVAQPTSGVQPYSGWEHPGSELRGHYLGHWLSAAASALTGGSGVDASSEVMVSLRARLHDVVKALQACQAADGYLSAFPSELLDRFEAQKPVWAPLYTLHKLLAGLNDAAELSDVPGASDLGLGLAGYLTARAEAVVKAKGLDYWRQCLNLEYGGVAEALRSPGLHEQFEHGAQLFDKPCFHGPLAAGHDPLQGIHANAHLPLVPGAVARFGVTGEAAFLAGATSFFDLLNATRTYATGGNSYEELWHAPHALGDTVHDASHGGTHSAESCSTHNALKIAHWLSRARVGGSLQSVATYASFMERATWNGILATQRGTDVGRYLYMLPHGHGVSKAGPSQWRPTGWSDPYNDFWCCVGTMSEAFARFHQHLYLQSGGDGDGDVPTLHVLHHVSSTVVWTRGLGQKARLVQTAESVQWTAPSDTASVRVQFSIQGDAADGIRETASLAVRIPAWATGAQAQLVPAGGDAAEQHAVPGATLVVSHRWQPGDALNVRLQLGAGVRVEPIADTREPHNRLHALLYGPLVLAGLTDGPRALGCAAPADGGSSLDGRCVQPVPVAARNQLVSVRLHGGDGRCLARGNATADGASYQLVWAQPPKEVPGPARRRRGGTDAHSRCTWRLTHVPGASGSALAVESFDRPGTFLCAPTSPAEQLTARYLAETTPGQLPACSLWATNTSATETPFTLSAAAAGSSQGSSFLGVSQQDGAVVMSSAGAVVEWVPSFAQFPPVAFWAQGTRPQRRVLLMPIADVFDETYTAYHELG